MNVELTPNELELIEDALAHMKADFERYAQTPAEDLYNGHFEKTAKECGALLSKIEKVRFDR